MGPTADVVLLVTTSYDLAARPVADAIHDLDARTFRLNTDQFPTSTQATVDEDGRFALHSEVGSVSSDEIRAVWYRRHAGPTLPDGLDPAHVEFVEREARAFLTGMILCLDGGVRWVSHPGALWIAEKKPLQLRVASELGFQIPATRISNRPSDVRALAADGQIVAKATSSGYISHGDLFDAIFTSVVSRADLADLGSLSIAPVTFQEHLAKLSDIRVTVVGSELFAAEILSQEHQSSRVDWRAMDVPELEHRRIDLPAQLEEQCLALVSRLNLRFGAIDFVRTAQDDYYFLEINPNGEWLWIEDALGYPIAATLATELLR